MAFVCAYANTCEEYAAKPGDPILTGQLVAEQVIGVG
jgi:hypothetical protein